MACACLWLTGGPYCALLRQWDAVAETGWEHSAEAWISRIDEGEPNRELLLDPVMLNLCGDVSGLRVLDVGCGEGRFCRMLSQRGAHCIGLDPTSGLIRAAGERGGTFVRAVAETMPFATGSFDLVTSYLSLIDITGYRRAIREMARMLRPGGRLLAANISFASAAGSWIRDGDGRRLYRPMDRYLEERTWRAEWRGISIDNWHRPLSAYMDAFLGEALVLERFLEPVPEDDSLRDDPYCEDWFRVPEFVVMRWRKP